MSLLYLLFPDCASTPLKCAQMDLQREFAPQEEVVKSCYINGKFYKACPDGIDPFSVPQFNE